jgi:hypothetical protein
MKQIANYKLTFVFELMYRKGLHAFRQEYYIDASYWFKQSFDQLDWCDSSHPLVPSIISMYRTSFLLCPNTRGYKEYHEGLATIQKDGFYGFKDTKGRIRIPCVYEGVSNYCAGLGAVRIGGKYGFIDKLGRVVIRPEYDEVFGFHDGCCIVRKDEMWEVINQEGAVIAPFIFEEAWLDDFDLMVVIIDDGVKITAQNQIFYSTTILLTWLSLEDMITIK